MARVAGLKYVSLHEPSGYGTSARRYLRALARGPRPITWAPMVPGTGWRLGYEPLVGPLPDDGGLGIRDPELDALLHREIDYDTVLLHLVPEYYPRWRARETGKRIVAYTTWETDRPPHHWPALLNTVDLVLVPCVWNREVFRRHGVTVPIEVVPHVVHPGPFSKAPSGDRFTFYAIGPWSTRKAHWFALEAFTRAFTADEPVRFVLKTSPEDFTRPRRLRRWFSSSGAARKLLRRHPDAPPVEVATRTWSEREIDALHASADCYVLLTRGEGWCIPAFDAAAFGTAVVATRFGGVLDYLGDETAYLVDCRLDRVQDRRSLHSYSRDQRWATPDLEQAARLLRRVFEHREEARDRGARAARFVRETFSADAVLTATSAVL